LSGMTDDDDGGDDGGVDGVDRLKRCRRRNRKEVSGLRREICRKAGAKLTIRHQGREEREGGRERKREVVKAEEKARGKREKD